MIIGKTITENKEEMNWEEIISEKKTVSEISKETGYSESYIYFIARKLGLSFKTFRGMNEIFEHEENKKKLIYKCERCNSENIQDLFNGYYHCRECKFIGVSRYE